MFRDQIPNVGKLCEIMENGFQKETLKDRIENLGWNLSRGSVGVAFGTKKPLYLALSPYGHTQSAVQLDPYILHCRCSPVSGEL